MVAQNVPSLQVPAMVREPRPLEKWERRELIQEATCDDRLWGFSLRVLIEVDYHYNAQNGDSFPSQEHIAGALKAKRRAVRRAIDQLIEFGYVTKTRVGRKTVYALREPLFTHHDGEYGPSVRQETQQSGTSVCPIDPKGQPPETPIGHTGGTPNGHMDAPLTLLTEPGTNSSPTVASLPPGPDKQPKTLKPKQALLPDDFEPTEDMIQQTIAKGLSRAEVLYETEQFKLYHASKATLGADWNKGWHYWMNQHRPGGRFYRPPTSGSRQRPSSLGSAREETANPVYYDDLERRNQPSRPKEAF
jgi:biotin operon repressor